ncbi:MAG: flagellar motor protein MotB [Porticoccaceae bacterium]|jgi:chemotaxis protein MotB|nr:OmpA family protein [Porticoccaceae bacterium]MDG1078796.1 flagellar motor protein MotB [Porticoccaceae bacterium]MDG1495936.1 flagellar motor protein MotB [Porticoccaceae bacterium]
MADDQDLDQAPPAGAQEPAPAPAEDCPPCKGGAPAWMATFADMATLLMAFFVLLLSFAEVSVPKYKQIAGSLRSAFGVARIVPKISIPTATSLVKQEYTPALAEPTVIDQKRQRSEDITQEFIVKKTESKAADFKTQQEFRSVQEALAEQIEQGQVVVSIEDNKVVVELRSDSSSGGQDKDDSGQGAGGPVSQVTIEIASKVVDLQSTLSTEIQVRKQQLASGDQSGGSQSDSDSSPSSGGSADQRRQDVEDQYQQIRLSLAADIQNGLAEVERDGDKIIVRLASQGSFVSGSANLQPGFAGLLTRVGDSLSAAKGKVRVEGHTDNIPVAFSERFNSNWDLSAARSASVADFFSQNSELDQGAITVAGFADTRPIESNNTAAGRARNRRIEVIVDGS